MTEIHKTKKAISLILLYSIIFLLCRCAGIRKLDIPVLSEEQISGAKKAAIIIHDDSSEVLMSTGQARTAPYGVAIVKKMTKVMPADWGNLLTERVCSMLKPHTPFELIIIDSSEVISTENVTKHGMSYSRRTYNTNTLRANRDIDMLIEIVIPQIIIHNWTTRIDDSDKSVSPNFHYRLRLINTHNNYAMTDKYIPILALYSPRFKIKKIEANDGEVLKQFLATTMAKDIARVTRVKLPKNIQ